MSYGESPESAQRDALPAGVELVEMNDTLAQAVATAVSQPNSGLTLNPDQQAVTPLPVAPPDPVAVAAQSERTSAQSDLVAQYQASMDRLTQIEIATAPTNAQVIQAIRDMATIEKRVLRFLKSVYPTAGT